jgi:predicted transcriptional regulator
VGYQRPEISYVIVVDRRGRVIEVTRGLFTESEYEQVRERIRELINEL